MTLGLRGGTQFFVIELLQDRVHEFILYIFFCDAVLSVSPTRLR